MQGARTTMVEWKDYIPLGSALFVFLGVFVTALIARLNTKTTVAKDLTVNADTVQLTDRQFQARWEERIESFTQMQGENYSKLLDRAGEANERLLAEVEHHAIEIRELRATLTTIQATGKELQRLLAACEARDTEHTLAATAWDARASRMAREIRRLGGNLEC